MKQKKVLSFVLALCLVFALSVTALAASFSDVSSSHWANDEISDVVSRGIFLGTSATTFEPEADMTRAMFVTVLSRLAAADVDDSAATNFTDVATGVWYTGAVAWGTSNNIVQGLSATTFGPDQAITREQMATLIQRYVQFAGVTLPETVEAVEFTDADEIGDYAKDAVAACQKAGLINGMEDGSYQPKATATRAQVATIISRLAEIDKAITYTVSFDSNGGSDVAAQKVKGGEVATKPANPTKDGASFDGWYTDSALTAEYDFSTPVQANFTLYAKWNESGSSSGGSSGGGGGGGSSSSTVDEPTEYFAPAKDGQGNAVERTDVALTVSDKSSKSAKNFVINLKPAVKDSLLSMQYEMTEELVGEANDELNYGTIFQAEGANWIANPAGFTPEDSEEAYGYTAMAVNFAKALEDSSLANDAKLLVIQTNPALEMYAKLGATNIAQNDNGKWVKTAETTVGNLESNKGSLIIPDSKLASKITIEIYTAKDGAEGALVQDKKIATYTINNSLSFALGKETWTGAGAAPAATYVDGVESSVATGMVNDVPTAQMTVSGSVNINLPINDETAKSDMASVLTEAGAPNPECGSGKFTIVGVDLGAMLKGIGIEGVDTLTIVQQNPALKMFKDVDPTNDTIKQEGSVWTKTASYATSTFDSEKYNVALNGKQATILVKDGEGENAKVLLEVVIANSGLKFTAAITNVAALELALENAADGATITLDKAFYDSLENAEGPLVISAGTTPVIIQGRSGQELPVGIEIKRGNIELKDVNVNVSGADLLADADGAAAGIYVSVTGENAVLENVILNGCDITLSGEFEKAVDGVHVFGDGSHETKATIKDCNIVLEDVNSSDNKINGVQLGTPAAEVSKNSIKGATRGVYASWVGAEDLSTEEAGLNIFDNTITLRDTDFVNSAEYFVWLNEVAAAEGFGTVNGAGVPDWFAAASLDAGQSVIVCYSDTSLLEKYEQADKTTQKSYYQADGAWVEYNLLFQLEDFAAYPFLEETYGAEKAYNVGWAYKEGFNYANDRISLEVGLKDVDGKLIVSYTANKEELAWQLNNSYVTADGKSSAPFAASCENLGEDNELAYLNGESCDAWIVEKGSAYEAWEPASCYVTVTTADGAYTLTQDLN